MLNKVLRGLLTIFLVGSHFFLTGKLDAYLYDFWPNERLEYNLAISMYLASALSAAVLAIAVYVTWALKMPKVNFSRKEEKEEEEAEIGLPEGPLYSKEALTKFSIFLVKDVLANYATNMSEIRGSTNAEDAYARIVDRALVQRPPKSEWN